MAHYSTRRFHSHATHRASSSPKLMSMKQFILAAESSKTMFASIYARIGCSSFLETTHDHRDFLRKLVISLNEYRPLSPPFVEPSLVRNIKRTLLPGGKELVVKVRLLISHFYSELTRLDSSYVLSYHAIFSEASLPPSHSRFGEESLLQNHDFSTSDISLNLNGRSMIFRLYVLLTLIKDCVKEKLEKMMPLQCY